MINQILLVSIIIFCVILADGRTIENFNTLRGRTNKYSLSSLKNIAHSRVRGVYFPVKQTFLTHLSNFQQKWL